MSKRLSWDEIKKLHPNEWVCLVDVDWPDTGDVQSGVVHSHDPKHSELLKKQRGLRSAAIVWTGKIRGRIHVIDEPVGSRDAVDQRFDPAEGVIWIRARVVGPTGDRYLKCILDTGSTRTILDTQILDELGYGAHMGTRIFGISDLEGSLPSYELPLIGL